MAVEVHTDGISKVIYTSDGKRLTVSVVGYLSPIENLAFEAAVNHFVVQLMSMENLKSK